MHLIASRIYCLQSNLSQTFSKKWEKFCISPIPKVNKPVTPSNHRSISALPILPKGYERAILHQTILCIEK